MRLMAPQLQTLVDLAIKYGERYTASKNEKGLVDFSDLEHYALEILTEHQENGELGHLILQKNIKRVLKKY